MRSMTVRMTPEVDDFLNMFACVKGITKGEAMLRAFTLLKVAYDEKQKGDGSSVGLVRQLPDNTLEAVSLVTGI